jgi:hypothetical protein
MRLPSVPRAIGNVAALARNPLQHGAKQKRSAAGKQAGNWSRLVLVSESFCARAHKTKVTYDCDYGHKNRSYFMAF